MWGRMIGGLLRFAPGRLRARQDRAPSGCGFRWWVVSWLPLRASPTNWTPRDPQVAGPVGPSGRDGNRQRTLRACISRGWLKERLRMLEGPGGCPCRAARRRVWPCPSPSRSYARSAAPAASLTASLQHGIGRRDRQAREPASGDAAQPSIGGVESRAIQGTNSCHLHARWDLGGSADGGDRARA